MSFPAFRPLIPARKRNEPTAKKAVAHFARNGFRAFCDDEQFSNSAALIL